MALTIETNTVGTLSLDDFARWVEAHVNPDDIESLATAAEPLRALANNRRFLAERMNEELAGWRTFEAKTTSGAESISLKRGDRWFIRANVWAPCYDSPEANARHIPVYEEAHDHNFSFLTVGYLGPGYETTIHEVDPDGITVAAPGEPVALRWLERTSLPVGKVMLYRASRDVHTQHYPPALSISLNLIAFSRREGFASQFYFDTEAGKIDRFLENAASGRVVICRLAACLGDGTTAALLEELAKSHPAPRVRVESSSALAALEPSSATRIWERAMDDSHTHVRAAAGAALRALHG